MSNHLKGSASPYLLQHAENPVDWWPWCDEAFAKAKTEDKPVFLSIGYSTCHWCHVMAHESFEDAETAKLLNKYFIAVKVDKEERPDIDGIYMSVCQAMTGSGGWPTSIFMTQEQKPFFAGTYFPKDSRYGMTDFKSLLKIIGGKWENDRKALLDSADRMVSALGRAGEDRPAGNKNDLIREAVKYYRKSYDEKYGGFGGAPKFPSAHNLWFLLNHYKKQDDADALRMATTTLEQMYRGGLFDHIGYGFSRYSTDRVFLVPHFEKMLCDNALLIIAYCASHRASHRASRCASHRATKKTVYLDIAEKTAAYILREMTSPDGGFYTAQDADSDGEEVKYYVFTPGEIISLLGEKDGAEFNRRFGITEKGNFEGKNIPNLLGKNDFSEATDDLVPRVYEYRSKRAKLHLDDKILTSWNSLTVAAFCRLYRETRNNVYLEAAKRAERHIAERLCSDGTLYVSGRGDAVGERGFIDDYAYYIFALLSLCEAALDTDYLKKARNFCEKAIGDFFDIDRGGFYLYGKDHKALILRPKETYDGAIPSGNSVMAYNLVKLFHITRDKKTEEIMLRQLDFMSGEAGAHPAGYAMFLNALSDYVKPPQTITVVMKDKADASALPFAVSPDDVIKLVTSPSDEYPLLNDKTTFYVCRDYACLPPVNEISRI